MAEERQPARNEARMKAQQLAKAAGKDWRSLSKEDRRPFLKAARSGAGGPVQPALGNPAGPTVANPWRDAAMQTATAEGKKWRDMPKEERQKYLAKAREDWNRKLAQERKARS
jgi:hypothetical protein